MLTLRNRPRRVEAGVALPSARTNGLVTTQSADELLVYDQANQHLHHLNQTAAVIWRLCDGRRGVAEVSGLASTSLGEPIDEATVRLAIGRLERADLLTQPVPPDLRTSTQTRRRFLKSAAVTGAVAVPTIVSVTSALAATKPSACGIPCAGSGDCSGKNFNNTCNNCWWMDCNKNVFKQDDNHAPGGIQPYCFCPQGQQGGCPFQLTCPGVCPPGTACNPSAAGATTQNTQMNAPLQNASTQNQVAPTDTPTPEPTNTPVPQDAQPPAPQDTQPPVDQQPTDQSQNAPVDQTQSNSAPADAPSPTPTETPPPPPPPAAPNVSAPTGGNPNTAGATVVPNVFGNGNNGNNGNGGG